MSQSPRKSTRLKRSRKRSGAHDDGARRAETDDQNGTRDAAPESPLDSEEGYRVGYGRPPTHTRFKPGESGNSKGRSPQSRNFKTIVKQVLSEQVKVRARGRPRRMGRIEYLFRTTFDRAAQGDPKAVHSLFTMIKLSGYGAEVAESDTEFLKGIDHDAVLAEFLRHIEPDAPASSESSPSAAAETPASSKKEKV